MVRNAFISILVLFELAVPVLASTDIIPCTVGNKWQYDCYKIFRGAVRYQGKTMASTNDTSFGSSVYEVLSVDDKPARPVYEYRETTNTASCTGGTDSDEQTDLKLVNDDAGQRVLSTYQTASSLDKPDKQDYDPPLLYYVRDAAPGKEWTVGTMRDENTTTPLTARAVGRETVTVPAGTFKDCLKVIYVSDTTSGTVDVWQKQFTITAGRSRGVYWVADGVGVVKELEIATSTAETPGPDGKTPLTIDSASCSVSELRPGFIVK
jgi:hypothetical protein